MYININVSSCHLGLTFKYFQMNLDENGFNLYNDKALTSFSHSGFRSLSDVLSQFMEIISVTVKQTLLDPIDFKTLS